MSTRMLTDFMGREWFTLIRFGLLLGGAWLAMDRAVQQGRMESEALQKQVTELKGEVKELRAQNDRRLQETREDVLTLKGDVKLILARMDDLRATKMAKAP